MKLSVTTKINAKVQDVWQAITNFEQSSQMISGIKSIEILNKPEHSLIGFKWKETREMFGKEASEVMEIIDCEKESFYKTRAVNHGMVYISGLFIKQDGENVELTMNFDGQATTFLSKALAPIMNLFMRKSMISIVKKDLEDIKNYVEAKRS